MHTQTYPISFDPEETLFIQRLLDMEIVGAAKYSHGCQWEASLKSVRDAMRRGPLDSVHLATLSKILESEILRSEILAEVSTLGPAQLREQSILATVSAKIRFYLADPTAFPSRAVH